jgi:hypothetical protein
MCQNSMWTGNGHPGAFEDANGRVTTTCEGSITVDGQTMTWAQANARSWSAADIASMVADNPGGTRKPGRPASSFYIFKNAIGLLTYAPASSAIRTQLWNQLAAIPGVQLDGQQKDSLGRTGWRLTLGSPGAGYGIQSILIDTDSGMPLEESDKAPGNRPNVVTIASAGPANSAPTATAGALKTLC